MSAWQTNPQIRPRPAPDPTPGPPAGGAARRDWLALAVLLVATFMGTLDVSIVNVAAPALRADLHMSGGLLQLVISGYSLAFAAALVTGARLGDDYGHKRLFLGGLAVFTLASLACGVAPGPADLVAARVAQGLGAAAMVPQVMTVIQLRFRGAALMRAFALQGTVIASGAVVGLVVGGALVNADLAGSPWRSVFLINVPIGLLLLPAGARWVPMTSAPRRRSADLPGVALLAATMTAVLVPLVFGHQAGWAPWTWLTLAASGPLAVAFVRHLTALRARGGDPLIDLRILRERPVAAGLASVSAQMIAYGGFLFTLTLHLQAGLGYSALRCGLVFVPYAGGFALASIAVPQLAPRAGRLLPPLGLLALGLGYLDLGFVARNGAWNAGVVIPLLTVAGAGFGAGFSPIMGRTLARVPVANAHDASGLLNTVIQISYALGVATIGSWFLSAAVDGDGASTGSAFGWSAGAAGVLALGAASLTLPLNRRTD